MSMDKSLVQRMQDAPCRRLYLVDAGTVAANDPFSPRHPSGNNSCRCERVPDIRGGGIRLSLSSITEGHADVAVVVSHDDAINRTPTRPTGDGLFRFDLPCHQSASRVAPRR